MGSLKINGFRILEHSVTQQKKPHAILFTEHHLDFEEGKTPSYMRKCKVNGKWELRKNGSYISSEGL